MDTMTKGARRRIRHEEAAGREPAVIKVSIIILWVVVFACAGMLVPPMWTVVVKAWKFRSNAQECSLLELAAARHACYEELGIPTAQHPAKGALAPLRPSVLIGVQF
jgi:hypothetical protein